MRRLFLFSLAVVLALAAPALGAQGTCDPSHVAFVRANTDSARFTTTGTVRPPAYLQRAMNRVDSLLQRLCLQPTPPPVDTTPKPKPNQAPVAAFSFRCVPGPSVEHRCTFDASASSDADGQIVTYTWSSPGRADRDGATTVWGFEAGTHSVTLSVTDDSSSSASATQAVVIVATPPTNPPPTNPPPTNPPPTTPPPPSTPPANVPIVPPALPQRVPSTAWPQTSRVVTVNAGDNLQAALDSAKRGDEIVIAARARFTGNFVLRQRPGSGWLVIRTASLGHLPPAGHRVSPADSVHMATLETPNTRQALHVLASQVRLVGLEVTATATATTAGTNGGLLLLGDGSAAQNTLASVPGDIVLDRVYVHGLTVTDSQRCVALNSGATAVIDSDLTECHARGFDSQAIGGWNGPGPYLIQNNRLQGAGENVMFGGADPSIPNLNAADITLRNNYIDKPLGWKAAGWTVKNLLETKQAVRLLAEGNVFENCWVDGQTGFALVFKSANQSGRATWAITSDVTFRYNLVRNSAAGLSIAANPSAHPALPAARFLFEHNIFEEIGTANGTTVGRMVLLLQGLEDVELRNNTLLHNAVAGQFIIMDNPAGGKNLVVRDNIATWGGPWGAVMGTAQQGSQALAAFMSPYAFAGNVVAGLPQNLVRWYPGGNAYPPQLADVGFVDAGAGNYALGASSPHKGKGTNGQDPGADVATVRARAAKAIAGTP